MQLSVACNLIPEGVRMLIGRWTISHRRSWITVCVFCCNAHIKSHSNCLACTFQCSINCPSVICLPSMLFICYGETPLVNCGPRSYFLYWYTTKPHSIYFLQYCSLFYCKHFLPHYTINPLFLANRWDWHPHWIVGAKYFGCVVCRFHVVADAGSAPCH